MIPTQTIIHQHDDLTPESPLMKLRCLSKTFETCNFPTLEPENFEVPSKQEVWVKAMEEEIKMIEKNKTCELADQPTNKKSLKLSGSTK